tara:strand:- start:419 stop:916 length:498 start_codon:yes stop_codon:yes gene_type:complete
MAKIFLWSGRNPLAWSIKYFTDSKRSHCGFILDTNEEIIDSDWRWFPWSSGVLIRDFAQYKKYPDRLKIIDLPFTDEQNKEIIDLATSYVGHAYYDLPLVASFVWEWWSGDKAFNNMKHRENAFTCSEFVAYCINKVTGHPIIEGRSIQSIRPHELGVLDEQRTT